MLDNAGPDPAGLLAQPAKTTRRGYLTQKFARVMMAMNEFVLAGILAVLVTAVSFLIEPFAGYLPIALLLSAFGCCCGFEIKARPCARAGCDERPPLEFPLHSTPFHLLHR